MRSAFAALRGPGDPASASSPGSMAADLTPDRMTAFVGMMEAVSVPPFERFYEEQKGPVLAQLRRLLGRHDADDAFQETFLRALRAYPSLEHGRHLRAWALTDRKSTRLNSSHVEISYAVFCLKKKKKTKERK